MDVFPSAASKANNLSYLINAHPSLDIVTARIVYCNVQHLQNELSIFVYYANWNIVHYNVQYDY